MPTTPRKPTPAQYRRIVFAWREMRRGVAMGAYRDLLFEGLELSALDALDLLVARDRIRMTDFAAALRIEKSTATRALDRLESAGLAARFAVDAGSTRRSVIVRITPRGRTLQAKLVRRRVQLLRAMTREFSADEIVTLGALLDRLVKGIDQVVARVQRPAAAQEARPAKPRKRRATARS